MRLTAKLSLKLQALSAFEKAIIISIIIVFIITIFFLFTEKPSEYYTSFYMNPDLISYNDNGSVTFQYGVICNEKVATSYELEIYHDNTLIDKYTFTLLPKQDIKKTFILDDNASITRGQVRLFLSSPNSDYDLHFWIKK